MNNKIALFVSLSIFSCSLTSFADVPIEIVVVGQVPTEIVVVGQAPSGSSSSIPSTPTGNTPVPNPTGMNQGIGYAEAKAAERAAKEKGYNDCVTFQKNVYATTLAKCNADAASTAAGIQISCLGGSVIIGGLAFLYLGPEETALAVTAGWRVVAGLGVVVGATVTSGCQSLAGTFGNVKTTSCASQNAQTIDKICGPILK